VSPPLLVVAGIFVRDGRLLLARRPQGAPHAGLWELPGGKLRPGESPEEALAREWLEELDVLPAGLVPDGFARDGDVVLLIYRVRALLGDPRPRQCEAVRWCRSDEALLLAMPPADRPVVERLAEDGRFRDTEDAGTPALLDEARERLPYIDGSDTLSPGEALRFRKQGVGKRPFLEGVLVATPSGPRAYENLCPHVPIPLDRIHDDIVSANGRHLVCQNHRALFELPSGRCVSGPCEGEVLREIPIERAGGGWAVAVR
jgi:8-oxo-dGTP diphosphatase